MGVRFLYTALTEDDGFLDAVATRAALIKEAAIGPDRALREVLEAMTRADLVVTAAEDVTRGGDSEGNRRLLVDTLTALGVPSGHIIPIDTRRLEDGLAVESARAITDSAQPVVFAFGSVTGWTLRRLRDTVRQLGGARSRPRGLVLHSRPQSVREWQAIRSMFDGECAYIWQTFLPWDSPLRHEADLLSEFAQHLDDHGIELDRDVARYAATRQQVSDPPDQVAEWSERVARYAGEPDSVHPATVFWGPSLRRPRADRGPFGRQLDHISTYAAVASSMHRTRVEGESREGPFGEHSAFETQ